MLLLPLLLLATVTSPLAAQATVIQQLGKGLSQTAQQGSSSSAATPAASQAGVTGIRAPVPENFWINRSGEPFEPHAAETLTPEQERFYRASQWQIMWWKFKRHRIAVIAGHAPATNPKASISNTPTTKVLAPTRNNGK